ncbi:MAG: GatB/YqeY domain-containing protein [Patescibacteria group bacterium]
MDAVYQKIQTDVRQAIKSSQKRRVEILKYLLSLLQSEEIKLNKDLDGPTVMTVLQKEMKRKKEALEMFKKGQRADLVAEQEEEITLLSDYLPEMLTEKDLEKMAQEILVKNPGLNFGQLMGQLVGQVAGRADGNQVSLVVKKLLNTA